MTALESERYRALLATLERCGGASPARGGRGRSLPRRLAASGDIRLAATQESSPRPGPGRPRRRIPRSAQTSQECALHGRVDRTAARPPGRSRLDRIHPADDPGPGCSRRASGCPDHHRASSRQHSPTTPAIPPWSSAPAKLLEDQRERARAARARFFKIWSTARPQEASPVDEAAARCRSARLTAASEPASPEDFVISKLFRFSVPGYFPQMDPSEHAHATHRHDEGNDGRQTVKDPVCHMDVDPAIRRRLGRAQRPHLLLLQQALRRKIPGGP